MGERRGVDLRKREEGVDEWVEEEEERKDVDGGVGGGERRWYEGSYRSMFTLPTANPAGRSWLVGIYLCCGASASSARKRGRDGGRRGESRGEREGACFG